MCGDLQVSSLKLTHSCTGERHITWSAVSFWVQDTEGKRDLGKLLQLYTFQGFVECTTLERSLVNVTVSEYHHRPRCSSQLELSIFNRRLQFTM